MAGATGANWSAIYHNCYRYQSKKETHLSAHKAMMDEASAMRRVYRRLPVSPVAHTLLVMGGPNLEVFRFGVYVFVPIAFFYYFNLPEYYNKFVRPDLVRRRVGAGVRDCE